MDRQIRWNFAHIPGLEEEKEQLRMLKRSGRIPHAQLFLGAYGSASLALALAFARYVLCTEDEDEPCEKCAACQKSAHWVHPDLNFSFPVIGTKVTSNNFLTQWREKISDHPYFSPANWFDSLAEKATSGNISVDECRAIIQKLQFTAVEGRYKILLLWGTEFLGKEGNRLLKMIEEPPEGTLFLFVGADVSRILPTVLSRCQILKIRPFSDHEIAEALVAGAVAYEKEALQIAFQADGNLGEAFAISQAKQTSFAESFYNWMRSCYKSTGIETARITDELAKLDREEMKAFFQYALQFVRQMLFIKADNPGLVRLSDAEKKAAAGMVSTLDLDRLEEFIRLFEDAYYSVERNANAKLLMLNTSIQIHALFRNKERYASGLQII